MVKVVLLHRELLQAVLDVEVCTRGSDGLPRPEVRRSTYMCIKMSLNRHYRVRRSRKQYPQPLDSPSEREPSARKIKEVDNFVEESGE